MKDKLLERHVELLRCVNTSDSERQHVQAVLRLQGFEDALRIMGLDLNIGESGLAYDCYEAAV